MAPLMVPPEYRQQFLSGDTTALGPVFDQLMQNPRLGFTIRRGMLVHGQNSPLGYLRAMLDYTLAGRVTEIACPTLICQAENDVRASQSHELYDALTCPKQYLAFADAEGAGEHCEAGAQSLFDQRVFDWLDDTLAPRAA
jgi:hypothetical protein